MSPFSGTALAVIYAYQRWFSPRKGYRCAYSVLHGGTGCSGFVKHQIMDHGLWRAIPFIRQRFRDCQHASQELRTRCGIHAMASAASGDAQDDSEKRQKGRAKEGCAPSCCDTGTYMATSRGCSPNAKKSTPLTSTETAASNSSACDCSGYDCTPSGCDCAPPCCSP